MGTETLQQNLGYSFRDRSLLTRALTHPSTLSPEDNQRLEFLGDAVLEFCVSDLLYRKYPDCQEGELTERRAALVCEETLSLLAQGIGLGHALTWATGRSRPRAAASPPFWRTPWRRCWRRCTWTGAFRRPRRWCCGCIGTRRASMPCGAGREGAFAGIHQAHELALPEYAIVEETGPAHNRHFVAQVSVLGRPVATGRGGSKKAAEQAAAKAALAAYRQE